MKREHVNGAITVTLGLPTPEEVGDIVGYVLLQQDEQGNLQCTSAYILEPKRWAAALAEVTAKTAATL